LLNNLKKSSTDSFKEALANVIIKELSSIQDRIKKIQADKGYVEKVLYDSATKARKLSEYTLDRTKSAVGLK